MIISDQKHLHNYWKKENIFDRTQIQWNFTQAYMYLSNYAWIQSTSKEHWTIQYAVLTQGINGYFVKYSLQVNKDH